MGNIKKRTPNTWRHELTPQTLVLRLRYLRVHLAWTNPSSSNSGPFVQTGKSRDAVSLENIQHNSRWTYLSEIFIFGLDSTVVSFLAYSRFQAQRTTNTHLQANPLQACWSDTAPTRLGPTETWLASNKTSAILDSQSAGMRRSLFCTGFLECFFEKVLWGVVSLMTTRTVLVLATVVSIRDKFFYPCCARCHKKVYFRDAEATMWVRLFDCFQMQQHYTGSLNVKFLCCCWLFVELQALQSYQFGK